MAWLPSSGKVYLPPQKPLPQVLNTDDYIVNTNLYFYASTERLLTVGHPYFPVYKDTHNTEVVVPKVSSSQFRVFRVKLPDPNKYALTDKNVYDPEKERLVWRLRGLEVDRGGPLGIAATGHPLFNKLGDTENPLTYGDVDPNDKDKRVNMSFEPKQVQLMVVGCKPALGEYWDVEKQGCSDAPSDTGSCPAITLSHSIIQDGDMCDIGFGACNNKSFVDDKASVPLDIVNEITKWPDFIRMSKDRYGDQLWFYVRREQVYGRHFSTRAGRTGDAIPENGEYYWAPKSGEAKQEHLGNHAYFVTPSGSLNTSDAQVFNRPYWLQRAQGQNNGMCWDNQCFITLVDTTHATNFSISVYKAGEERGDTYTYEADQYNQFLRHSEEYEIEFVFQLAKVPLDPDVLAHLNVMNPTILDNWDLAFVPPPPTDIEDAYRYLRNFASGCPRPETPKDKKDPYESYVFWDVDLTEKFTTELNQYPLGRRFLFQLGIAGTAVSSAVKRVRTSRTPSAKRSTKRRRIGA